MNDKYKPTEDAMKVIEEEARAVAQCFGVADCQGAAAALRDRIVMRLGGAHIYVPQRRALERARVIAEMRSRFNGRNAGELAREYGLSSRHARRILILPKPSPSE
jgi:Mor family transcriptional regulator